MTYHPLIFLIPQCSLILLWPSYKLESWCLISILYVYYNIQLWVKQLEITFDMKAISLDGNDTKAARRVDTKSTVMEATAEWLAKNVSKEVVGGVVVEEYVPMQSPSEKGYYECTTTFTNTEKCK